jgi:hypothetical protein
MIVLYRPVDGFFLKSFVGKVLGFFVQAAGFCSPGHIRENEERTRCCWSIGDQIQLLRKLLTVKRLGSLL